MVVEAVQNYVNMVNGLNKASRERALATAKALLAQVGLEDAANDASERVSKLAEEILLASRANRELVENLIAAEVDKAAGRWGFVRTDDVDALREEIAELRLSLARATVKAAEKPAKKPAKKAPGRPAQATPPPQQPPLGGATIEAVAPESFVADPFVPEVDPDPVVAPPTPPEASTPIKGAAKKAAATKVAKQSTAPRKTPAKRATTATKATTKKTPAAKKAAIAVPAAPSDTSATVDPDVTP